MVKYISNRILSIIPTVLILSVIIFFIVHLTPGNPATTILGMDATQNQIEELTSALGLNKPLPEQYLMWITNIFKGNLGKSYFMEEPVSEAILSHMKPTLSLAVFSEIIALLLAVPLGLASSFKKNKVISGVKTIFTLGGLAVPSFVISLLLLILFSVKLKFFPVAGYEPISHGIINHLRYLTLPSLALGIGQAAYLTRIINTQVKQNLTLGYIKTAKLKGYTDSDILRKEIFRNSLIVVITAVGQSFGSLLAGAIVVETVFAVPGMGQLLINSITRRDLILIQGLVLVISLMYLLINLIVDISYGFIDPRIRLSSSEED